MNPVPWAYLTFYFRTPVFFVRNAIFANRHKVAQIYGPWERLITETQDATYSGWAKSFTANRLSGKECQYEWATYRETSTLANKRQFHFKTIIINREYWIFFTWAQTVTFHWCILIYPLVNIIFNKYLKLNLKSDTICCDWLLVVWRVFIRNSTLDELRSAASNETTLNTKKYHGV